MCYIKNFLRSKSSDIKYLVSAAIEIENSNPQKDRIIGICLLKYDIDTMMCIDKLNLKLCPDNVNISLKTYIKCGWTIDNLKNSPKFIDIANRVINIIGGNETAVCGYNLRSIIIPFIYNEVSICGKHIDFTDTKYVIDIKDFQDMTGVYYYNMRTMINSCNLFETSDFGIDLTTLNGQAKASVIIIEKMLEKKVEPEINFIYDNRNLIAYKRMYDTAFNVLNGTYQLVFTNGKYYMCPVAAVLKYDPEYINWCLSSTSGWSPAVKEKFKMQFM